MWRWNTIGTCFCKKLYFSLRHISTVQEAVNMYLGEGSNLIPENGIGCDPTTLNLKYRETSLRDLIWNLFFRTFSIPMAPTYMYFLIV